MGFFFHHLRGETKKVIIRLPLGSFRRFQLKSMNYSGYQYIYNMSWQDKKVSLSIYNHREGVKDTLAPYPPLEYDR